MKHCVGRDGRTICKLRQMKMEGDGEVKERTRGRRFDAAAQARSQHQGKEV